MKKWLLALLFILCVTSSPSAFTLETAHIIVDGRVDDWAGIGLFINDQVNEPGLGDLQLPGADIDTVKLAASYDRTRLYMLVHLTKDANPNLGYRLFIDMNGDCNINEQPDVSLDIRHNGAWFAMPVGDPSGGTLDSGIRAEVNGEYIEIELPARGFDLTNGSCPVSWATFKQDNTGQQWLDYAVNKAASACVGNETEAPGVTALSIVGPPAIEAGTLTPFSCVAAFDHGPAKDISLDVLWSLSGPAGTAVDNDGVVRADAGSMKSSATLTAELGNMVAIKEISLLESDWHSFTRQQDTPFLVQTETETATRASGNRKFMHGYVTYNSLPVVAMVLVNGQFDFSDEEGYFEIDDIPLNDQGNLIAQVFCANLQPLRDTFAPTSQKYSLIARNFSLSKQDTPNVVVDPLECVKEGTKKARISGNVKTPEGIALNVLALANGQFMFTRTATNGAFDLLVPLDQNDQVKLQVFCAGRTPYRKTVTPEAGGSGGDDDDPGGGGGSGYPPLVGVWKDLMAASNGENAYWHFYSNGKWVYESDQYTPSKGTDHQVYQPYFLHGTYSVKGDDLTVYPQVAKDRYGNTIPTSGLDDCWQFTPHYASITIDGIYVEGSKAGAKAGASGYTNKPSPCEGSATFFTLSQKTQFFSKTIKSPGQFFNK